MKEFISIGEAVMGLLVSNEQLRAVQPTTVIRLLERVRDWVELRWGNATANLIYYPDVRELRTGIIPMQQMIIHSVINAAAQAIKEQLTKEEESRK